LIGDTNTIVNVNKNSILSGSSTDNNNSELSGNFNAKNNNESTIGSFTNISVNDNYNFTCHTPPPQPPPPTTTSSATSIIPTTTTAAAAAAAAVTATATMANVPSKFIKKESHDD
jgi:hypothetical protein